MEVYSVDPQRPDPSVIKKAASVIRQGGLVGIPTETVYGIACLADCKEALERLRALKQRPQGEAFPVQVASKEQLAEIVKNVPLRAKVLINKFWPGPLTIVFPRAKISLGGEGLGVRIPAHNVALAVLKEVGRPVACPSCNPRSEPPATSAEEALRYFPAELDLVLDAGPSAIKQASTVVRVGVSGYEILREGLISREMIFKVLNGKTHLFVCTGNTCRSPMAEVIARGMFCESLGVEEEELQALGFRFVSAGTFAAEGLEASENAQKVVKELGYDLSFHRSRRLTRELIKQADLILCMEESHLERVLDMDPKAAQKARLLHEEEISDPIGGDEEVYRLVRDRIREALRDLVP